MGPPSYMPSVVDRNVVMRRIPVCRVRCYVLSRICWYCCYGHYNQLFSNTVPAGIREW